jgi:hypothetical protein
VKVNSQEVKFAENLHEVLPTDYSKNLGLLPKENRDAIAEDFRRWRECRNIFEQRYGCETKFQVDKANRNISAWIEALQPAAYREDMRRRLNYLHGKMKK